MCEPAIFFPDFNPEEALYEALGKILPDYWKRAPLAADLLNVLDGMGWQLAPKQP